MTDDELVASVTRELTIRYAQPTTADDDARAVIALVRANVRGACTHCNRSRGKRPLETTTDPERPALDIFD